MGHVLLKHVVEIERSIPGHCQLSGRSRCKFACTLGTGHGGCVDEGFMGPGDAGK